MATGGDTMEQTMKQKMVRTGLPPVPRRMKKLPVDDRGYPVPWFVAWVDGKPDFRCIEEPKRVRAWNRKLCWLCGEPLGTLVVAVIGPMCVVTRTSSEPFSHRDCAEFAVRACPFLSIPSASRREANLPKNDGCPGLPIYRNPGVTALYTTRSPYPFRAGDSFLFNVGQPVEVAWYAEGRPATRAEVEESIRTGLPALEALAEADGPAAVAELAGRMMAVLSLLPREEEG